MEGEGGVELVGDQGGVVGDGGAKDTFESLAKLIRGGRPDRREPRPAEV